MQFTYTKFVRPNGKQVPETINVPDELKEKIELLENLNCRVTVEPDCGPLTNVCIECQTHGGFDYDSALIQPNRLLNTIYNMVERFNEEKLNAFITDMKETLE